MTRSDMHAFSCLFTAIIVLLAAAAASADAGGHTAPKPATETTKAANASLQALLDFGDKQDFEDAARGLVAPLPDHGVIRNAAGQPVWDMPRFAFIEKSEKAPDTVNASLWRQSRLAMKGGLFKVVDRLYQVRNADLSNLTIFEGDTGLIVADPLISAECAKAALELYYMHRPRKPVIAVIYSHSHVDHYGGVRGVLDEKDVAEGRAKVLAPVGFMEAAVAENVLAGTAMSRRAGYMYGNILPASPVGQVGAGLGMTTSTGTVTLIPPTDLITRTGQTMNIDGLDFEFMLAPDSEAPAEMHWYVRQLKAVTAAENCCHTLHNTYTLRGAKIRDPLAWSKYLDQTITLWGDGAEVMYGMHHWPVWGHDKVLRTLRFGRDGYRFINDQTLRLANLGHGPDEIANTLAFPPSMQRHWAMRGYYGTLFHNVKATYVRHLGWFDGNPANLHSLAPVEAAKKYVAYMGGAEAVMEKARQDYAKGEYRWVAEVMNRVVFADPDNAAARGLTADAFEQLGYQAESGPWRNFYLSGAKELREGVNRNAFPAKPPSPDMIRALPLGLLLDYMGVRLNGEKADGKSVTLNLVLPDTKQAVVLTLENSALSHTEEAQSREAAATVTLPRPVLTALVFGRSTLDKELEAKTVTIQGDKAAFGEILSCLDTFDLWFNIVTP